VTRERGTRWPHFQVVDIAVQGLLQTEDKLCHVLPPPFVEALSTTNRRIGIRQIVTEFFRTAFKNSPRTPGKKSLLAARARITTVSASVPGSSRPLHPNILERSSGGVRQQPPFRRGIVGGYQHATERRNSINSRSFLRDCGSAPGSPLNQSLTLPSFDPAGDAWRRSKP